MARSDIQNIQIQAIEKLLLSGDLFTFGSLEAVARRDFAVDDSKTGLVRRTISRLVDQGRIQFYHQGRHPVMRAVSPEGGF
jgi:hypothetical protein